jgi:hypothetical protein
MELRQRVDPLSVRGADSEAVRSTLLNRKCAAFTQGIVRFISKLVTGSTYTRRFVRGFKMCVPSSLKIGRALTAGFHATPENTLKRDYVEVVRD